MNFNDLEFYEAIKAQRVKAQYLEFATDILKIVAIKVGQNKKDEAISIRDAFFYPKMRSKKQPKEIKV